jgi:hypothetical protein
MTIFAGIWSETEGGFVDGPLYTQKEADDALMALYDEDIDNVGGLSIVPMCQEEDHDEQPEVGCEICATMRTISLRDHVKELHPRLTNRRKLSDLAHDHGNDHHRHGPVGTGHVHNDPEAGTVGPGANRRPRGWTTGEDVEMIVPGKLGGFKRVAG